MSRLQSMHRVLPAASALALLVLTLVSASPARAVDVQRVVSPMGIEAWLVENHAVPVIAIEFAFRGGVELDPVGKEGLANLASILLDEGAGDLDSATFQTRLSNAAIDMGFDASVDGFYGSLKTVTDNADEAFDLLRLALTEPRFDADAVERMRAAVQADIRRRVADPGWMGRRTYYDLAFGDHPYARPSRGTAQTLSGLTVEDLRGYVGERFNRANLLVGVSGDVTAAELGPILDRLFGALPAGTASPRPDDVGPLAGGERILVKRDGPQSVMLLAQPGMARSDPDFYTAYVVNHILGGGGFTSRLTDEVRERRGLTYGIGSYLVNFDHTDLLMASSSLSNANVAQALELIRQEWRRMAQTGVTAEELEDAKTFLTGSFPLRFTSTDRIASILLGMQIEDLGIDFLDRRNEEVEAVTLANANRVAGELFDVDALTVVVVGAPEGGFQPDREIDGADLAARELGMGG